MTIEELKLIEKLINKKDHTEVECELAKFIINREIKLKLFDPNNNKEKVDA